MMSAVRNDLGKAHHLLQGAKKSMKYGFPPTVGGESPKSRPDYV